MFLDSAYDPEATGDEPPPRDKRSGGWVPWVAGLLFLAVVAAAGAFLLVSDPDAANDSTTAARTPAAEASDEAPAGGPDRDAAKQTKPDKRAPSGEPIELAAQATATTTTTAPDGIDSAHRPVTFAASNLLDGTARTCWRMAGDGTGAVLTFTFPQAVTLSEVGIVNGYAKFDPPNDWYRINRRVLKVEWTFDGGSAVTQTLGETRTLQAVPIDPVEATVVRLEILGVSGDGGRDFTAISEVALRGER